MIQLDNRVVPGECRFIRDKFDQNSFNFLHDKGARLYDDDYEHVWYTPEDVKREGHDC